MLSEISSDSDDFVHCYLLQLLNVSFLEEKKISMLSHPSFLEFVFPKFFFRSLISLIV